MDSLVCSVRNAAWITLHNIMQIGLPALIRPPIDSSAAPAGIDFQTGVVLLFLFLS